MDTVDTKTRSKIMKSVPQKDTKPEMRLRKALHGMGFTELKEAIEMSCYFSVNSLMLKSKKGIDLASRIPSKLMLPESDGPFATLNGKPIMPWEAMDVCSALSDIWNVSRNEAEQMVLKNSKKIIDI